MYSVANLTALLAQASGEPTVVVANAIGCSEMMQVRRVLGLNSLHRFCDARIAS